MDYTHIITAFAGLLIGYLGAFLQTYLKSKAKKEGLDLTEEQQAIGNVTNNAIEEIKK